MDQFQIVPHLAALLAAYGLASPIGWDREKSARSAGLRTFPLVAMAACGFVQTAQSALGQEPEALARVMEGIITGIGFIGGGAILKHGASVKGTATAASIWPPAPSARRWGWTAMMWRWRSRCSPSSR